MKICSRCKIEKPLTDFYKRGKIQQGYCKKCNKETRIEQTRKNRLLAINFLGGKCSKCGYNKCPAALHFHHTDPKLKDDLFNRIRNRKIEYIYQQLLIQKCILLCANCHAEEHWL